MLVQVWPLVHLNDVFPIRRVLVQNFDMGHSSHSALIIGKSKFMSENTCLDLECQEYFLLGFYSFSEVMIGENQRVGFCCGSWFDLSQE